MKLHHAIILLLIGACTWTGCQGTGKMVNFDPQPLTSRAPSPEAYHDDTLRITVSPFTDNRREKSRIGQRTHFWGGTTQFNVWDGQVGQGMADLAVAYLQQRKWQAALESKDQLSDVVLSGQVMKLEGKAKSGFGFTDIDVVMEVRFEAKNISDGSTVRTILGSNGSDSVVAFDPKDVEQLTNEVAKDLFDQLFRDLTVKDRAFRLRANQE